MNKEKKILLDNIFSLGVIQWGGYIIPLITVPYLLPILGPEYFGLISFSTATITYFGLISNYGFDLSATREISIYRKDQNKINEVFSSVMIIRIVLMTTSFFIMSCIVFYFEKFSQNWELYFITFGVVIGEVLFPKWLFQGMERMKFVAYLNIASRGFFTLCIFVFIRDESDYLLVPLFTSLGSIIIGIYSLYLVKKLFNVTFSLQSKASIKYHLYNGWHIFLSSIASSFYTVSTVLILGFLTNNIVVGYFAAGEKIINAFKGLTSPITQALYPFMSLRFNQLKSNALDSFKKIVLLMIGLTFPLSVMIFIFSKEIIEILLGKNYQDSIIIIQIMSFLPFIVAISNVYIQQGLFLLGYQKMVSRFITKIALIHILYLIMFVYYFEATGAAISVLITEVLISLTAIYKFNKIKKALI